MITARDYQIEAIQKIEIRRLKGIKKALCVVPTGGGKTVIAAVYIKEKFDTGAKTVFIAHRKELINQTYRKLIESGIPPQQVGVIMARDPRNRPMARVQVASISTLIKRNLGSYDFVFFDEAHRCDSKSYRSIQDHYKSAFQIGLTATPYRENGKGLGNVFEDLIKVVTPAKLIEEGHLVEPKVFTIPSSDLAAIKHIKVVNGDYDKVELGDAMSSKKLVGDIVEHWKKLANDRSTVVFASSIDHSKAIADEFKSAGISAEHLDGKTLDVERDAILERVETGETKVVCNYGVLTEGWDQPRVKCCILARPTKSTGLAMQMMGRILRPWRGVPALILDHAGVVIEHGFPQDDRDFSLNVNERAPRTSVAKQCPRCFAIMGSGVPYCAECGLKFDSSGASSPDEEVEVVAGELVEIRAANVTEKKSIYFDFLREAIEANRKSGWAAHRFKDRFGEWPSPAWKKQFERCEHERCRI